MPEHAQHSDQSAIRDSILNSSDASFEPKTLDEARTYHEAYRIGRDMWDKHLSRDLSSAEGLALDLQHTLELDPKTGLATEGKWKSDLTDAIETLRDNEKIVVMVADLNGFKAVNDALGHESGDELLGIVGRAFMETFRRESDYLARGDDEDGNEIATKSKIARLGGDEFASFTKIYDTNKRTSQAEVILANQSERLNKALTNLTKGTKFEKFNVSIELGGVEYDPSVDSSPEDLFARADAKMFEVKYKGKMDNITSDDIEKLKVIIPYLKSLGTRVEQWLETAVFRESD